jgi:hypothetical protein
MLLKKILLVLGLAAAIGGGVVLVMNRSGGC